MDRRGFTLIEMTVVIGLLALFAAMVIPNLSSQKEGREHRAFYQKATVLIMNARETAIESQVPVSLRFDESSSELYLEQMDDQGATDEIGRRVQMPDGITASEFRVDGDSVGSQDWAVTFYPDGSSDGGGIGINDESRSRAFEITRTGHLRRIEGDLPDTSQNKWKAGENEVRI